MIGAQLQREYGLPHIIKIVVQDFKKNKWLYGMALPMIVYYIMFRFAPMYGVIISFKDFSPGKGIIQSPWVGLKHFETFFSDIYFGRIIKNTLAISLQGLVFGFPAPIILALLMNELRSERFKRCVQTTSYLPHFISLVVVCGMIVDFTASDGVINDLIVALGGERSTLLLKSNLFRPIYIISDIWQGIGWGSIIYLAALTGIDQQLYEAATIDGAKRFAKMWHIALPGISPTIIILFILRIGSIMDVGYEKILLLYNANIYETADVISTYVYRKGLLNFQYSFSTAVGLFNSVISFMLVFLANWLSKTLNETSLW